MKQKEDKIIYRYVTRILLCNEIKESTFNIKKILNNAYKNAEDLPQHQTKMLESKSKKV